VLDRPHIKTGGGRLAPVGDEVPRERTPRKRRRARVWIPFRRPEASDVLRMVNRPVELTRHHLVSGQSIDADRAAGWQASEPDYLVPRDLARVPGGFDSVWVRVHEDAVVLLRVRRWDNQELVEPDAALEALDGLIAGVVAGHRTPVAKA